MINHFTIKKFSVKIGFILLLSTILSCKKESRVIMLPIDQVFYALSDNSLVAFNAKSVKTQLSKIAITGLATGEKLLSIDFRPATGELYSISNLNKLYTIDVSSAVAKAVSTVAFAPILNGSLVSIDFNPTTDQLIVVTNTGQNFRLNPETAVVIATDANVGSTSISGIAHQNNYAGATTTTLYDIDLTTTKLMKQESNGALTAIGNLNLDLGTNVCFDISPATKDIATGSTSINGFAIGKTSEGTQLFSINLGNGSAKFLGTFPNLNIQGIAMPTHPVAYAVDNTNNFIIFDPTGATTTAAAVKTLTGLQAGETIRGIDMRPANGQIYALGSSSRLYTINIGTGTLTQVGSGTLNPLLTGSTFGFDFNPVTDVIKVIGESSLNLRIDPKTAAVTVDPVTGLSLSAAAFSNNYKAATTTILYAIDASQDKLLTLDPNTGVVAGLPDLTTTTGKLDMTGINGFDILSTATTNLACGIFNVAGTNRFYTVNLSTSLATPYGITFANNITGFTLGLRF